MNLTEKKSRLRHNRAMARTGAVLLCIALLFSLVVPPMPVHAIAGIDDIVIAAAITALAAGGVGLTVTGLEQAGIIDDVGQTISRFCADVGKTVSDFTFTVMDGVSVMGGASPGAVNALRLAPRAYAALNEFSAWVVDTFGLTSNGQDVALVDGSATAGTIGDVWDFTEDEDAYLEQIGSLSGIDSAGGLMWYPTPADLDSNSSVFTAYYSYLSQDIPVDYTSNNRPSGYYHLVAFFDGSSLICNVDYFSYTSNMREGLRFGGLSFVTPISGAYSLFDSKALSGYCTGSDSLSYSLSYGSDILLQNSAPWKRSAGQVVNTIASDYVYTSYAPVAASFVMYMPVFRIIPDSGALDPATDATYGADTRAGSITNNTYGYYTESGDLVTVGNQTIVNEAADTYYNPVTNETYDMSSWTYDYSDRSYTVTTNEGDTTTITYGDEYTTIQEGDTVYNVYYVMEGDGTLVLDPGIINIPDELDENKDVVIYVGGATGALSLDDLADLILEKTATNTLTVSETAEGVGTENPPLEETIEDVGELGLPSLGEYFTTRFPFSIPWDIARGFKLLAAPAKTPYFEVDFFAPISGLVGGWKGSTAIVLDFSEYEIIGQVSRWASTIGFCLLLAAGTKKLIWTA